MKFVDVTFPMPAQNLACDEVLLDICEDGREQAVLRFWESPQHFVVLGHGNRVESEVNVPACHDDAIPILRRHSGGGTVLQGPGCLNFALILNFSHADQLESIQSTNQFVLGFHKKALETLVGAAVDVRGSSDLTIGGRKFSGNSQRRRRRALLFHGTILHSFDIDLISKYLVEPAKQPEYREHRSHGDFLMNLSIPPEKIRQALRACWNAFESLEHLPVLAINGVALGKYSSDDWNLKL